MKLSITNPNLEAFDQISVDSSVTDLYFKTSSKISNCDGSCCQQGVMLDSDHKDVIINNQALIKKYDLENQLPIAQNWFERREVKDPDFPSGKAISTRVVNSACIFLNSAKRCILQITDQANKTQLKPFYCKLYPLTINKSKLYFDQRKFLKCRNCCIPDKNGVKSVRELCKNELELIGDLSE